MSRTMRRHGRGLNSFLLHRKPEPTYKPKSKTKSVSKKPNVPAEDDPARYYVSGRGAGDYAVTDTVTGKPVATQLDSRDEAQAWIDDRCKVAKAA